MKCPNPDCQYGQVEVRGDDRQIDHYTDCPTCKGTGEVPDPVVDRAGYGYMNDYDSLFEAEKALQVDKKVPDPKITCDECGQRVCRVTVKAGVPDCPDHIVDTHEKVPDPKEHATDVVMESLEGMPFDDHDEKAWGVNQTDPKGREDEVIYRALEDLHDRHEKVPSPPCGLCSNYRRCLACGLDLAANSECVYAPSRFEREEKPKPEGMSDKISISALCIDCGESIRDTVPSSEGIWAILLYEQGDSSVGQEDSCYFQCSRCYELTLKKKCKCGREMERQWVCETCGLREGI